LKALEVEIGGDDQTQFGGIAASSRVNHPSPLPRATKQTQRPLARESTKQTHRTTGPDSTKQTHGVADRKIDATKPTRGRHTNAWKKTLRRESKREKGTVRAEACRLRWLG